ncbi:dethiobiotin synthase [Marinobacter qingdaonensis]|jgi:dethiobiotin synthetase|uniref:ATP-dependent dethiobiotin synthetase BioD n=1 Tax=Marinobacter qingdaonensis TaxID=3108486 RepID=A0ABU5P006_9GAMM|nr:dethiobiotin synthase [Marinobacter sp. ASW11-75]MEA1081337.1 dethiobiotin synthase [Marinobacter sp. ASW11-75]MEE2763060.1 dethiobiotin synthase [Pseudomonadota bacterium]MEE3116774.1 dethiobiotin synthase [Pseudomonadota bacterium]
MAKHTYFVTGTDTGVGKTMASAAILEAAKAAGKRTLGMKPIASGCDQTPDGLRNEDALALQKAMTESLAYDLINPVTLEPAIAPHVAAAQAGKTITAQRLIGFCRGLQMRPADLMLVEGAGGWRVPLNDRETFAAVPRELEMPVILVVALKLGSINHAMLTAEAIRADGLRIAGWVANRPEQEPMSCERETLEYLLNHLGAPCLGVLPWVASGDPAELAVNLELQPLFEN